MPAKIRQNIAEALAAYAEFDVTVRAPQDVDDIESYDAYVPELPDRRNTGEAQCVSATEVGRNPSS